MSFPSVRRSAVVLSLVTSLLLGSTGCSCFQPKMQTVTIDSIPQGSSITVDGQPKGYAPLSVELERDKEHVVVGMLNGNSVVQHLNPKLSTAGVLDIVGTVLFLVPGIGLFTPGAHELDSTKIVMQFVH